MSGTGSVVVESQLTDVKGEMTGGSRRRSLGLLEFFFFLVRDEDEI